MVAKSVGVMVDSWAGHSAVQTAACWVVAKDMRLVAVTAGMLVAMKVVQWAVPMVVSTAARLAA